MDDSTILMIKTSPDDRYSVIIEDDGRVAYAYLRADDIVVSDVWLYNRCEAPLKAEWRDRTKLPFANPLGFGSENKLGPILSEDDVNIQWGGDTVWIHIHGLLWAVLNSGEKPGCCRLALRDGPLAKLLETES